MPTIEQRLQALEKRVAELDPPPPRRVVIASLGESEAACRARLELEPADLVVLVEDSRTPPT